MTVGASSVFVILFVLSRALPGRARTDSEAQVQCSAKCLSDYRQQATKEELEMLSLYPDRIMVQCNAQNSSSSNACRTCIDGCALKTKKPFKLSVCDKNCKTMSYPARCRTACHFLHELLTTNPGVCPAAKAEDTGPRLFRYPKCDADRDCYRKGTKCCPRGRQQVCVKAEPDSAKAPPTPTELLVLTNKNSDGKRKPVKHMTMVLDWSNYNLSAVAEPVIFLVQIRDYKGYRFDSSAVSPWIDLVMTSRRRTVLGDLKAGTWYQMRLAAISRHGLRAYSAPTKEQKLREARRPSPPRDLQEDVSRIHQRKVDIHIRWQPPRRQDLPLSKYEIVWREHYSFRWGEESSSSRYSASVPPTTTQFVIRDLKPSTMYKIELTAIVFYGEFLLRSKKISLFITTTHIPTVPPPGESNTAPETTSSPFNESDCMCGKPRNDGPMTVGPSFFGDGKLQVPLTWNRAFRGPPGSSVDSYILEWAPKVCVASAGVKTGLIFGKPFEATVDDSKTQFLSDLHFNCHYHLRVKGLTDTGQEALRWNTCFCTTSCLHTAVKRGSPRPKCPGESLAFIPQRPLNLRSRIWKSHSDRYSASIVWDSPARQSNVRSYSIVWGPRVAEPVDKALYGSVLTPKLDLDHAESKVIHMSKNRHTLHDLRRATLYIVRLKFISRNGDSPISSHYFRTPGPDNKQPAIEIVRNVVRPLGSCAARRSLSVVVCLLALMNVVRTLVGDG